MLKIIFYALVTGFGIYEYPDLMGLFAKSGNDFPIIVGSWEWSTNPMSLLCLGVAIFFLIFMPKLWRKIGLLKLPARIIFFLSVSYVSCMIYSMV